MKTKPPEQGKLDDTRIKITEGIRALFENWVLRRAKNRKGLSDKSAGVYRSRAYRIAAFFGEHETEIEHVTDSLLTKLMATMPTSKNRARYLDLIDELLLFEASLTGKAANRTANDFRYGGPDKDALKRKNRPSPEALTSAHKEKFVAWFQKPMTGDWRKLRNRVICAVMLGAGLKPNEALDLTLSTLHYESDADRAAHRAWKLTVPGTGNYPARDTPLAPYAKRCLSEWVDVAIKQGVIIDEPTAFVFPNAPRDGAPLEKSSFRKQWIEILEELELKDFHYTPHTLRNTFGASNLSFVPENKRDRIRISMGYMRKESIDPLLRVMTEKFPVR